jgi:hypothetical protein
MIYSQQYRKQRSTWQDTLWHQPWFQLLVVLSARTDRHLWHSPDSFVGTGSIEKLKGQRLIAVPLFWVIRLAGNHNWSGLPPMLWFSV